ncbi:MAG TPA: YciI family protein [Terriglobales bacterium]|nr:YciI family protein [Terriglobales bacterium]
MEYLLLIYHSEIEWTQRSADDQEDIYQEYRQLIHELRKNGQLIRGDQLKPSASSVTVRLREGNAATTDGPFAETKEQLGGYFLLRVNTRDEAVRIARRIPSARTGSIEVREIIPTPTD